MTIDHKNRIIAQISMKGLEDAKAALSVAEEAKANLDAAIMKYKVALMGLEGTTITVYLENAEGETVCES